MSIAPYLKEIGRGKEGARSLPREQARELMQRVLTRQVSDLELGAFALAMRIKGESAQELAGFLDAAVPLTLSLHAPGVAIVLPSYNGARKQPNLTPLLAALLAREGVPVLVHGPRAFAGRVTSADIFAALGQRESAGAGDAAACWQRREAAFMTIDVLHPPLARLLALREVLGLRNPGHTLAKLLPVFEAGRSLRVVNHTHPEYAESLSSLLALTQADAMLMRGTEGEPVADARRQPRLAVFLRGALREDLSRPAHEGALAAVPNLPAADAAATARWIDAVLAGRERVPAPIAAQAACLLQARAELAARTDP
jgi:anthranilate phosphoribosyltransferase